MAYKEETDQQFFETIVRQAQGRVRSPIGDHQYHGNRYSAHTAYDDYDPDNGYEVAEPEQVDATRGRMSSFTKPYRSGPQIGAEINEPMPQLGGYSTETGSRHLEAPQPVNAGMEPHLEMRKVKKAIETKEKELHELQRQKVELMRKITGRL